MIDPICAKCNGTGWYYHSHNHDHAVCDACCMHDGGWWDLTEDYYKYKKDADNGCCLLGCGTLRRDIMKAPVVKIKETKQELKKSLDQRTLELEKSNDQRDRAVQLCDDMFAWQEPAQARQSAKDLSALKKEIREN